MVKTPIVEKTGIKAIKQEGINGLNAERPDMKGKPACICSFTRQQTNKYRRGYSYAAGADRFALPDLHHIQYFLQ